MDEIQRWRELLQAYETSGLSGAAFSRRENIAAHRFYYWKKRLSVDAAPAGTALLKVRRETQATEAVEINFGSGRTLRLPATVVGEHLERILFALSEAS